MYAFIVCTQGVCVGSMNMYTVYIVHSIYVYTLIYKPI